MKRLSVRLPEAAMRRMKSLSALRGVSLQEAVQQALEAWAAQPQPADTHALDQPPDSLAGAGLEKKRPTKRAATAQPNRRRPAAGKPSLTPGGGQPENLEGAALEWFRRAGTLDWSKCSAVESVPAEIGNVWVVRGTAVPVAAIFRRFAEGQRFEQIAEALGLTQEQLIPVLEFAAEGGMFPRSAR
jgi:uncharacterized protein (DUF433 family)